MNPSTTLRPRLNCIFELVKDAQQNNQYSWIWDCCCDHGYLGIKILHEKLCDRLIFVDQLPHIISQLAQKLSPFDIGSHRTMVSNAADIRFEINMQHLVILAGVGGETIAEIVSSIEKYNPDTQIDYIFCPSSGQQELRAYLIEQGLGVISEKLICENKRYYEILYIKGKSSTFQMPVVTTQSKLWDTDNEDHQRYLRKINTPRKSKKPKRNKVVLE